MVQEHVRRLIDEAHVEQAAREAGKPNAPGNQARLEPYGADSLGEVKQGARRILVDEIAAFKARSRELTCSIAKPTRRRDGCIAWDGLTIDITREVEAEQALRIAKNEIERIHSLASASFIETGKHLRLALMELDTLLSGLDSNEVPTRSLLKAIDRCRNRLSQSVVGLRPARKGAASAEPAHEEPVQRALTPRQRQVYQMMAKGLSNKEIALKLGIVPGTAKLHVASILRTLGLKSRRTLKESKRM